MPNNLTELIPQMTINVLEVARENAVMPTVATTNYSDAVAQKGDTIKIDVMNEFDSAPIVPGNAIPAANNDIDPTKYDLNLNEWEGSSFLLTEKDMNEIVERGQSQALSAATRAVVNAVDRSVLGNSRYVYNAVGVAGTTPFATDPNAVRDANTRLSTGLAPKDRTRNIVCDEFAYNAATVLPNFSRANEMGTDATIRDAMVPYTLGFNWHEDQNMETLTATATGTFALAAAAVTGAQSILIDDGAGALPVAATALKPGILFTIAGDTQVYSTVSYTAGGANATVEISPPLAADAADNAAITVVSTADSVINLAFHPQAFHLAMRPTGQVAVSGQSRMVYPSQTVVDPQTGLVLTLKFFEGYHQTTMEVSALWGTVCPRPEFACRILG